DELTYDDPNCGRVTITIYLKPHPNKPDTPALHLIASGDCQCKGPSDLSIDQRLGPWQVLAYAELVPTSRVLTENTVEVTFGLGERQYEVFARCGCNKDAPATTNQPDSTPDNPSDTYAPPKENIVDRICFKECGSLYEDWIHKERRLKDLEADARDPKVRASKKKLAEILELIEQFKRLAARAKAAYFQCMEECYKKAVRAGEIPKVPDEVTREANSRPGSEEDKKEKKAKEGKDKGEKKNSLSPEKEKQPEKKKGRIVVNLADEDEKATRPIREKGKEEKEKKPDEKTREKKGKTVVKFAEEVEKSVRPKQGEKKKEASKEEKEKKTSSREKGSKAVAVAGIIFSDSLRKRKPRQGSPRERDQ
ncbi:MAG: hypothetical protein AB1631_13305, partial [Acidobacteriota bacterium]